jgi:hypothetical protein
MAVSKVIELLSHTLETHEVEDFTLAAPAGYVGVRTVGINP